MYILGRFRRHKMASSPQVGWTSTSIGVEWLEQMLYCRSSWEWAIKLHIHKMRKDLVANKSLNWYSLIATLQQRWVKTEKFLSKLVVIVLILLLKNWFSLARKISIFTFSKTALNNKKSKRSDYGTLATQNLAMTFAPKLLNYIICYNAYLWFWRKTNTLYMTQSCKQVEK